MIRPLVAHTFESSSIVTSVMSELEPMPPCSSSYMIPKRSFSRKSSTTSHGNSALLSISAARGAIRSRAIARTSSRISRCSSVSGSAALTRRSLEPVVEDGFDVVAVGVAHECAVVARVVLGPLTGSAVVGVAGGGRRAVERVDGLDVADTEREVHVLRRLASRDERERADAVAELHAVGRVVRRADADHRRDRLVEALRLGDLAGAKPQVVD